MAIRERLMSGRDELMARREALMERASEIRERFHDVAEPETVQMTAGLSLLSGGIAWAVTQVIRGHRGLMAMLMPAGLMVAGAAVAGRGAVHHRREHIASVEDQVREDLSGLGPLARFRVLRDMGSEQFAFVRHAHD